ncbi:MAG: putative toxin-antitoxin system toxin component, PIN family, partial [Deltaproteobacteria bacterium]|nr:putative toxin-antitoxin system toxin component, PIN family [Deltaproteobacteria bacterium]
RKSSTRVERLVAKRAVFDTNVLVSAYLWTGPARRALEKARSGEWILLNSRQTTDELIRVLAYDKFGLRADEIQPIIEDLSDISEFVEFKTQVEIITRDPTDNIFLSLAIDGQADAIVSGDHHLLDIKKFKGIPIITVRKFLAQ